jgi:hypothetical protein
VKQAYQKRCWFIVGPLSPHLRAAAKGIFARPPRSDEQHQKYGEAEAAGTRAAKASSPITGMLMTAPTLSAGG